MSFFLRDKSGNLVLESTDIKKLKADVQAIGLPAGEYTIYKAVQNFTVKEVPARVSMRFESLSKRGPRKSSGAPTKAKSK